MKVSHRATPTVAAEPASPALASPTPGFDKAPRLSCCCRLSELLPLVRQLHDATRAARLASEPAPSVAA